MKKKKGFTLVELLAVIVILAVILVIAVPRISEVINNSKKASFEATAKTIANQAEKKYMENEVLGKTNSFECSDVAKLNENDYGACKITIDTNGNASVILNGKKNGKFDNLTCSGTKDNMICGEGQTSTAKKCYTGNTSLAQGDEYTDGQYTYRYKQEYNYGTSWSAIDNDGWGVALTDKESTDAVTTELCSSIDDKPIVSMSNMFANSQATSIDLSSFDTSNVTDMKGMFFNANVPALDLSSFETLMLSDMSGMFMNSHVTNIMFGDNFDISHVNDMNGAFVGIETERLDLSKIRTEYNSISSMKGMFTGSKIATLNMQGFDASNVTDMSFMFDQSQIDNLNLTNIKTNNVTNMYRMFSRSHISNIIGLTSLDTSNVTNMSCMFGGDRYSRSSFSSIDVSNFDTSNVTDMSYMFGSFGGAIDGIIGVEKFNTSNVENMEGMFAFMYGPNKESFVLDLSNFDTNKVTNMSHMFDYSGPTKIKFSTKFNTSNVTDMSRMFAGAYVEELDLSTFDTSNVSNMTDMLDIIYHEGTIPAYAKTCEDAARLNASSGKLQGLTFTVKNTTC